MVSTDWSSPCIIMMAMLGFFGGSMLVKSKTQLFQRYTQSLDAEQRAKYIQVIRERTGIFVGGILLGLVVSGILSQRLQPLPGNSVICLTVGVTLLVASGFYLLMPKRHYMLRSMHNQTQVNDWLEIYRSFQRYTYWGALVGVVVYYAYTHS